MAAGMGARLSCGHAQATCTTAGGPVAAGAAVVAGGIDCNERKTKELPMIMISHLTAKCLAQHK